MRPKRVRQIDPERKARLDGWKYEKTVRTAEEHPVLETEPVFERPFEAWTSSDFVRETTFGVTGKHTFHAQENLEILREYLNRSIDDADLLLRRSSLRLGKGRLENYVGSFDFDFTEGADPTKYKFLAAFWKFIEECDG